jgi:hypothetical protein
MNIRKIIWLALGLLIGEAIAQNLYATPTRAGESLNRMV